MTIRIGINGFGRIGRTVTRILHTHKDVDMVGINDLTDPAQLAHGLKYDSVYGRFPGEVYAKDGHIHIDSWRARVFANSDPALIDWRSLDVDFVVEATGKFKKRADLEKHLAGGARKVVLSVPPKEPLDATIVMGVNDHILTGRETLVSNASCTTNAAAPITKVLHDAFTVQLGYINTIHAYTNDQHLIDYPHADWRRSRSAPISIIPTTTGAARAVGKVIPELDGKLDGMAYRVPVPNGSIVDMIFTVGRKVTVEEVNAAVKAAAEGPYKGIIEYQVDPIVSTDVIANPHSTVFDSLLTQVMGDRVVKVASWYDNEYGYSSRLIDLIMKLAALDPAID